MPGLGVVILAAGASRRLGVPKQLVVFHGQPLIVRAARTAIAAGVGEVTVLTSGDPAVAEVLEGLPVKILINPQARAGQGTSVRAAAAAMRAAAVDACLILLADQYLVSSEHLTALAEAWRQSPEAMVATDYDERGGLGVPVIFPAVHFAALASLPDGSGARSLIWKARNGGNGAPLRVLSCPDAAVDLDTPADLDTLRRLEHQAP